MSKPLEIYITQGNMTDSKYVLMLMEDGTLMLIWYYFRTKVSENNPTMVKKGNCTYIEYGAPNLFGTRPMIPFMTKDGILEERWEKIK